MADKAWIKLNIGGGLFLTTRETLQTIPNTRLAKLDKDTDCFYHQKEETYCYDHEPVLFGTILESYRTGRAHIYHNTCLEAMVSEFEFWGLDGEKYLSPCCLGRLQEHKEMQEAMSRLQSNNEDEFGADEDIRERMKIGTRFDKIRFGIWLFLERPSSSTAARYWAIVQILLTFTLMIIYALLTTAISTIHANAPWIRNFTDSLRDTNFEEIVFNNTGISTPRLRQSDTVLNVVFITDFVLRFLLSPNKGKFILTIHSVIDLICLVVFCIYDTVLRLVKVTKLKSSYVQLKAMLMSLRHSLVEIAITTMLITAVLFVFAVAAYQVESRAPDTQMPNIPKAFWWALISMTTVGYGDTIPKTIGGHIIGGLVPLVGILLTGLAISILTNNVSICSQLAAQQHRASRRNTTDCHRQDKALCDNTEHTESYISETVTIHETEDTAINQIESKYDDSGQKNWDTVTAVVI